MKRDDNTVLRISVIQTSPNNFNVKVEKWPDDVKTMMRSLVITEAAMHAGFERLRGEIE